MLQKVFDSAALPAADRVDAWHDVVARALIRNVFEERKDVEFRAALRRAALGDSQVTALRYSSLRARRSAREINSADPELYTVALTQRGGQLLSHAGRDVAMGAGDLAVYATFRPYRVRVDAGAGTAAVLQAQIPRTALALPENQVSRLLGTRLPGDGAVGSLLVAFLTGMAAGSEPYRPADAARLGVVLAELVTAVLAHHLDDLTSLPPETRDRDLFLRCLAFIRRNLSDPRLAPADVAAAHHVSTRQLQRVFQRNGRTVAAAIRRQRLEQARRELADPALGHLAVRAVAARCGMPEPAVFARAFRGAYGLPPRDYRAQAHAMAVADRP